MIYEYECQKCFAILEFTASIKDGAPIITECENCNNKNCVQRLYSVPVLIYDDTPKTVGTLAERNTTKNKSWVEDDKGRNTKVMESYWEKMTPKQAKKAQKEIEGK